MPYDTVATCAHVYVGKDHPEGWIPADWTQFLDISEDIQGFDIMTFNWKGKMGAEDFQSLKKYLKDEGYMEQACNVFNDVEK